MTVTPPFFVLAGPPGAGKTTLLDALSKYVTVVPEYARRVLAEERASGGRATGDQDAALFVERMLAMAISDHDQASGLTLFDRGLPDLLAFCAHYGFDDASVRAQVAQRRYAQNVFFLPAWKEIYETDDERLLDFDGAREFGDLIREAYLSSDYELIDLPKASVAARAQIILDQIRR